MGGNEVRGVGNINGDVKEGVGGGLDGGERGGGPDGGVLAEGSGDGQETTSSQVTKDRHWGVTGGMGEAEMGR